MVRSAITPVYSCAVCGKTTTRLQGFAALVNLSDEQGQLASRYTAVLGGCAAHRAEIPQRFADDAAAKGEVAWICDEPVELRPAHVEQWYADVDRFLVKAGVAAGVLPAGTSHISISSPEQVPRSCPHCGGDLSWGTGPHVADARARGNAIAWECLDGRAAGILG